MNKVSIINIQEGLKESIKKAVDLVGGFKQLNIAGKRVFLKPNFNTADSFPASSDPLFLETVIKLIKEHAPKEIIIGDSCTMTMNTTEVMKNLGIFDLAKKTQIKVLDLNKEKWHKVKIPNGKYLKSVSIPKILDEIDLLIFLPCLKTHRFARFTMSIKISVGFMKRTERPWLHLRKFEEKIAELSSVFNPDLIIMDARKCFITYGPEKGETRSPNVIMASQDRIAIDVEGLKILKSYPAENKLDLDVWKFSQIKRAIELGIGSANEEDYMVVRE